MRTQIVRIGNSRGVRIPKALLDQTGLTGEVELSVRRDAIVIRAVPRARAGWDVAFREMAKRRDDRIPDVAEPIQHSFDAEEWEW